MEKNCGCLAIIIMILGVILLSILGGLLVTNIIIWIVNGIFHYDLSDRFWYIFVAYYLICGFNLNITTKARN